MSDNKELRTEEMDQVNGGLKVPSWRILQAKKVTNADTAVGFICKEDDYSED